MKLKGHPWAVTSVSLSPDTTIRIWDAKVIKPHKGNTSSPNMRSIVSSNDFSVLPNFQPFLQSESCFVHADGWIRGSHQELIFWVLPEWRQFLPVFPSLESLKFILTSYTM